MTVTLINGAMFTEFMRSIVALAVVLLLAACSSNSITGGASAGEEMTKINLETNYGNVVIELRSDMPVTTGNFRKLVESGFYDGVVFHRVIADFMIQGGDPQGTGRGGPGYTIKDEFTATNRNDRGTISMANAGPNTGGSQFFINLVNNNYLDKMHPAFGRVVEGMDVVDEIGGVATDANDRPLEEVRIIKATVLK